MKITYKHIPFFPIYFLLKTAVQNRGISLQRIHVFIIYLIRYIILEPFRLLELLIFDRKIRSHQLAQDPVFVLGHWRSGTTYLQSLLCKDQKNTSTTIFNFLFSDSYYLTESWLKKPLNGICRIFKVKYALQRLPMDLNAYAELDSAMCAHCNSSAYTWGHLFPKKFGHWMDKKVIHQNEKTAEDWIRDYDYLIRKLSYKNKNKQVIVKSPGDTARIEVLLRKYPNAKFIYIHRDPIEVFHSSRFFWGVIQKQNSFQKISAEEIDTHILTTYKKVLTKYLASRNTMPTNQLIEIHFDTLQNKPVEVLNEIHSKLNLGDFPNEELNSFLQENKSYKVNQYATSPELEEKISIEWDFSYNAFPKP